METKAAIEQLLHEHLQHYPSDKNALNSFFTFLETTAANDVFSRKNFIGHITASAFIINADADKLLLLKHKALNRWLQPGGHVDVSDKDLLTAALREATEETGIAIADLRPLLEDPLDFDSHVIPENIKKHEPSHIHHDVRFLLVCPTNHICIAEEESTDARWIPLADIAPASEFKKVVDRIIEKIKK